MAQHELSYTFGDTHWTDFYLSQNGVGIPASSVTSVKLNIMSSTLVVTQATLVSLSPGTPSTWRWTPGATNQCAIPAAGTYTAEIQVTFNTGAGVKTFPDVDGDFIIVVRDDIGS